jgi:hypothetical protein
MTATPILSSWLLMMSPSSPRSMGLCWASTGRSWGELLRAAPCAAGHSSRLPPCRNIRWVRTQACGWLPTVWLWLFQVSKWGHDHTGCYCQQQNGPYHPEHCREHMPLHHTWGAVTHHLKIKLLAHNQRYSG